MASPRSLGQDSRQSRDPARKTLGGDAAPDPLEPPPTARREQPEFENPASRADPGRGDEEEGFGHGHTHECVEWCPICRTADVVRASVPPELRDQLGDIQREALSAIRAMIDHYLQRADQERQRSARVEDIPID